MCAWGMCSIELDLVKDVTYVIHVYSHQIVHFLLL